MSIRYQQCLNIHLYSYNIVNKSLKYMEVMTSKMKINLLLIIVITFIIGWLSSILYIKSNNSKTPNSIRQNSPDFQYINPLLFVDNSEENFSEYRPLESKINKYIDDTVDKNNARKVSVYFRDLNTSHWGGVNENELYAPSSMLKVAVLIGYLKLAEKNPDILNRKLEYNYKEQYQEYYKPNKLKNGSYTVLEMLQQMIIESDNTSMSQLVALHSDEIVKLYKDLKLPNIIDSNTDFMSTEDYSYIFRTLYNATYLRKSYSEQALKLLTFTKFDKGIVGGVGTTTKVAHKFGEHTITYNGTVTERQLHDCGIIYFPNKPYLLCIMTKGEDFTKLETIITDLSRIIFDFIKQ